MLRAVAAAALAALLPSQCAAWRFRHAPPNWTAQSGVGAGPVPNPTAPWWLNDAPLQHVSGPLPADADVVVIGAGITGASVARHIAHLQPRRASRTLVLDARGAAGGATGRNGGQMGPMGCCAFGTAVDTDGLSEALAERAFQYANYQLVQDYVNSHARRADMRLGGQAVSCLTSRDVSWIDYGLEVCRRHQNSCADPYCASAEVLNSANASERFKSPDIIGALYQSSGGTIWSARVAFALLDDAIARGVTLRTQTTVLSVDRDGDEHWRVHTEQGDVRARHVVFATNAYTAGLLPEFSNRIHPYRNQVVVTRPAPLVWDFIDWQNTPPAGLGYAYFGQRADGRIVYGADISGNHLDDSTTDPAVTTRILDALKQLYPTLADVEAEQVHTGITTWTQDGYPWVGELPDMQGCYVAAGFTEGMVQTVGSGRAVAQMLAGHTPTDFNPRYLPSARGGGDKKDDKKDDDEMDVGGGKDAR